MTYRRVIPRDLFNEANLLKCMGQLYLQLEKLGMQDRLVHMNEAPFNVKQWQDDGSISLLNVLLVLPGHTCTLYRPLNSREPYPLWLLSPDGERDDIQVFNDDGSLTDEMLSYLEPFRN